MRYRQPLGWVLTSHRPHEMNEKTIHNRIMLLCNWIFLHKFIAPTHKILMKMCKTQQKKLYIEPKKNHSFLIRKIFCLSHVKALYLYCQVKLQYQSETKNKIFLLVLFFSHNFWFRLISLGVFFNNFWGRNKIETPHFFCHIWWLTFHGRRNVKRNF